MMPAGHHSDSDSGLLIHVVVMISSVVYLIELIVRIFLLRAMGSNRVILTLEQHVDVLDELVRDNRVEVNFTLATNGMGFK